ncbi:poly(rC)-binding protein 3 [Eurytemora carolleeae]|uniref:poly(rC)-binding protein 3 n=1 Tax=Eurytemora carolleeae TaxID=1294199 RepID=UPI000C78F8CB|nr:poly(rC)-binding protein 3 [Eurytemora carolleeae]|eukprot:XP_023343267.1 poly(rC)-binding protein 3-like [Eurytemora affinis]
MATTTDTTNITLTIRILMQGKEVGSIIGKKGDIVKKLREEDLNSLLTPGTVPRPPITFRLVVPASQCGSLIGKGGSKIKEIREITGASVQVASEMLPNSTERTVTVSGSREAVVQAIYQICSIMSESPPKGITVPYTPLKTLSIPGVPNLPNLVQPSQALVPSNHMNHVQAGKVGIPVSLGSPLGGGILNPATLALLAGHTRPPAPHQTHEMTVPNELIGCIIGKGGSKVAEIRQLSGAMIRISNCEDRDAPANLDRTITISGNCESVALAQYLINMSMEVFRANLAMAEEAEKQGLVTSFPDILPPFIPNQYQIVTQPEPAQQYVDASLLSPLLRFPSFNDQIVLPNKFKATPSLISLPSIREQKFAPY